MIHWDHLLAITFLGVGGLILILQGYQVAGAALLGMAAGYAFKNGQQLLNGQSSQSTSTTTS